MTDKVKDNNSEVEEKDMQMDTAQSGSNAVQPQIQTESSTVETFSEAAMRDNDDEGPPEKRSLIEMKQSLPSSSEQQEMMCHASHPQANQMKDNLSGSPLPPATQPMGGGAASEECADMSHEQLLEKLIAAKPDLIPMMDEGEENPDLMNVNGLMKFGYTEVRLIIEWARKVPGYSDLCIDDQICLLKSSFMELNVFRLAYRSIGLSGSFKFAHNLIISEERCKDMGWGPDLNIYMRSLVRKMEDIEMDLGEFCLLNAIIFSSPDAEGLNDRIAVLNLQSRILQCFRKYCVEKYPKNPKRYSKMLLWLPTLCEVSSIATAKFVNMSLGGSITMNALILELFT